MKKNKFEVGDIYWARDQEYLNLVLNYDPPNYQDIVMELYPRLKYHTDLNYDPNLCDFLEIKGDKNESNKK